MDKSLDEIISTRPRNPRRGTSRRGAARAEVLGKTGTAPSARARYSNTVPAANGAKATTAAPSNADKIIVSNLPPDVNEAQIKELFGTTVGPTKEVTLHYNSNGVSKGIASVTFRNKDHCTKAYQNYHNRLIDGKRAMKIEIVVDPSRGSAPASLASRVAPAATGASQPARTGGSRRGGRGGGGGGGRRRNDRPKKSVADLDAEMEDYSTAVAPGAATEAAPAA